MSNSSRWRTLGAALAVAVSLVPARMVRADDAPAAPPPPREGIAQIDDYADQVKNAAAPLVLIGMGAAFSYQYGFNDPSSGALALRLLDKDHDRFGMDLFQLSIHHDTANPGDFGFMIQPAFGRYAKRFKSDWDGSGVFNDTSWENKEIEIQQVYLAYDVPIGTGLTLKGGKFNTLVGSEVNEPWNNATYSRQLLYTLCQPATHTGGLASYAVTDKISVTAGGIVGWDVVADNNSAPGFMGQVGLTPDPAYVFYLTTIISPEVPNHAGKKRYLFDYVSTIKPFGDALAIISNIDYGLEEGTNINGNGSDAAFWGISNTFDWFVMPKFDLIYRVEYFEDGGGIRTGQRQRVWEMTFDARYKITDYLYVRSEYRHDESDKKPFVSGDAVATPGQDTVAIEFGYAFL